MGKTTMQDYFLLLVLFGEKINKNFAERLSAMYCFNVVFFFLII